MIRRRLTSTKRSEIASAQPRRRRISSIPSPALPTDDRDPQTDDDLTAALRRSELAEGIRVRNALRQAIGGDIQSIVHEGVKNMSSRGRRRVLALLDRCLAGQ